MRKLLLLNLILFMLLAPTVSAQDEGAFSLQILHSADNESSFQDPNTLEPKILNFATLLAGLRELAPAGNSLYVTAGDHTLPGPFYEAAVQVPNLGASGLGDIAFYNAMGLAANGIGNHEFDGGINDFAQMLARANYPFLAVNLDFTQVRLADGVPAIAIGEDGANVTELAGKVARSAFVEIGGERIGLIGRAPADFFNAVENPDEKLPGLDFIGGRNPEDNQPLVSAVDQVLEQVAVLEAQSINKIILLDHAQDYTGDQLSAAFLRGIDIIVTAGSTGFMARPVANGPFNALRLGDVAQADYPTIRRDLDGNFVLAIDSNELYTYVGHLIVTFDSMGRLVNINPDSGPVATTADNISALETVLGHPLSVPADVQTIFDSLVATDLIQEQFEVIGTTTSALNGERANVRSRETNLGRLTADSTLWWARNAFPDLNVNIALKNGGGIRASILGPNITRLTVESALAFNNDMAIVEVAGTELLAIMENAVSRAPALDGRFPQVAGLLMEYDASLPAISDAVALTTPSRVRTLIVSNADGSDEILIAGFVVRGDLERTFRIVTNSFLLTGGDGYQALAAAATARGSENPGVNERQILTDYIEQALGGAVDLPEPLANERITRIDATG